MGTCCRINIKSKQVHQDTCINTETLGPKPRQIKTKTIQKKEKRKKRDTAQVLSLVMTKTQLKDRKALFPPPWPIAIKWNGNNDTYSKQQAGRQPNRE